MVKLFFLNMSYAGETLYTTTTTLLTQIGILPRNQAQWQSVATEAKIVLDQLSADSVSGSISDFNAESVLSILSATIRNLTLDAGNADSDFADWTALNNGFNTYIQSKNNGDFPFEDSAASLEGKTDDVAYATRAVEFYGYLATANATQSDATNIYTSIVTLETLAVALASDAGYYPVFSVIKDAHTKADALLTDADAKITAGVRDSITTDADAATTSVVNLLGLTQQMDTGINTIFRFTLPPSDSKVTSSVLVDFQTSAAEAFHSEVKITVPQSQAGLVFSEISYSGDPPSNDDGKDGNTVVTNPYVAVHDDWKLVFQNLVTSAPGLIVDADDSDPTSTTYGSENLTALHDLINYLFNVTTGANIKSDAVVQAGFRDIINDSFAGDGESPVGAKNGVFWSLHNALLNAGRMRDGHVRMENTDMIELVCPIRSDDSDMTNSNASQQKNYWNLSVNFLFT